MKNPKQLSLFDNIARVTPINEQGNPIKLSKKAKEYLTAQGVVCVAYLKQKNIIGLGKINAIICEYKGRVTEFHSKKEFERFLNHN